MKGSVVAGVPSVLFAAASATAFSAARDAVCATKVEIGCEVGLALARGIAMSLIVGDYDGLGWC